MAGGPLLDEGSIEANAGSSFIGGGGVSGVSVSNVGRISVAGGSANLCREIAAGLESEGP